MSGKGLSWPLGRASATHCDAGGITGREGCKHAVGGVREGCEYVEREMGGCGVGGGKAPAT